MVFALPIAWVSVAGLSVIVISYFMINYLSDREDRKWYLTLPASLGIFLAMLCVVLIPIDVYTVSWDLTSDGYQKNPHQLHQTADTMKTLYTICYMAMMCMAFIIMPFVYFYFEEEADEEDQSTAGRVCAALRYTVVFVFVFGVLLGVGFVVRNDNFGDNDSKSDPNEKWYHNLEGQFSVFDSLVRFVITCLATFGVLCWCLYGAYGLVVFPKMVMRSRSGGSGGCGDNGIKLNDRATNNSSAATSLLPPQQNELQEIRAEIEFLKGSYQNQKYTAWPAADRVRLRTLERKERTLLMKSTSTKSSAGFSVGGAVGGVLNRCWNGCCLLLAPIRGVVGVALLLVTLLVVSSMLLTGIDKLLHSKCKEHCGYSIDHPRIFNPLDRAMTAIAPAFPLDWFVFSGLVVFFFVGIVSGMMSYGVRFFCFHLYDIKAGATMPHGLVMGVWLVMFAVLAFNMQLLTLMPTYVSFGDQRFTPYPGAPSEQCSTKLSNTTHCVMTQIATFINTTQISQPFFGVVFFFSSLFFVLQVLLALFREFVCVRDSSATHDDEVDELDRGFEGLLIKK